MCDVIDCCRQLYISEQEKQLRSIHTDALKHLCKEVSCLFHMSIHNVSQIVARYRQLCCEFLLS